MNCSVLSIGGITATVFNVIYNFIRETRNRRWTIAAEITGKIDFYYLQLVKAIAHLDSVFEDEETTLSKNEWRGIQMEASPLFVDEQKIRAEVDIVYGVDSYESNQFDEVFGLLKNTLSLALSISDKEVWNAQKGKLKENVNQLARIRPTYRKKLVNGAKLWSILTSRIN